MKESLIYRLKERARIRRSIDSRKSVQEGKPDRIADLLEESATYIKNLEEEYKLLNDVTTQLTVALLEYKNYTNYCNKL